MLLKINSKKISEENGQKTRQFKKETQIGSKCENVFKHVRYNLSPSDYQQFFLKNML